MTGLLCAWQGGHLTPLCAYLTIAQEKHDAADPFCQGKLKVPPDLGFPVALLLSNALVGLPLA